MTVYCYLTKGARDFLRCLKLGFCTLNQLRNYLGTITFEFEAISVKFFVDTCLKCVMFLLHMSGFNH